MKRLAFLASVALVPFAAHGQALQSDSIGGMPYYVLPASGGCSAATPCSTVVYLHYMGGQGAAGSDIQKYFGGSWAQQNPHTIVIAPMMPAEPVRLAQLGRLQFHQTAQQGRWSTSSKASSSRWGTRLIERIPSSPAARSGEQERRPPWSPTGQRAWWSQACSLPACRSMPRLWPLANDPAAVHALCGVPLLAVHGTNDQEHALQLRPGPQATADGLQRVPLAPVNAGHGTWAGSSGLAGGAPLNWISNQLSAGGSAAPVAAAMSQNLASTDAANGGTGCAADAAGTGGFHVAGGQIIGPDGKVFIARGFGVGEWNMSVGAAEDRRHLPGRELHPPCGHIVWRPEHLCRFYPGYDVARARCGVLRHHVLRRPEPRRRHRNRILRGAAGERAGLVREDGGRLYKSNPYVWLSTNNEPSDKDASGKSIRPRSQAGRSRPTRRSGRRETRTSSRFRLPIISCRRTTPG